MRTVRCSGRLMAGVWLRGCLSGGVCRGGVCRGGVCPEVSAQECLLRGYVSDTPPEQNHRQVFTLSYRNYIADGN